MTQENQPKPGLLTRLSSGVLWLTIDRPEVRNALDWLTRDELVAHLEQASADLAVRCVVLTGSGDKAFCTGADLSVALPAPARPSGAPARATGEVARGIRTGWQKLVTAVLDCEVPVIAAVNGTAAGAGMNLALACDLVVAADTARFIQVFVRRGIAPDAAGAYLLTRLIGPQKAKELIFFGDDVSAGQAASLGLVNRVVPGPELTATVGDLARRLADGPTKAIGLAKWLVNRSLESDRGTALLEESWAQEMVMSTEDAQAGVRSFFERSDPTFLGW